MIWLTFYFRHFYCVDRLFCKPSKIFVKEKKFVNNTSKVRCACVNPSDLSPISFERDRFFFLCRYLWNPSFWFLYFTLHQEGTEFHLHLIDIFLYFGGRWPLTKIGQNQHEIVPKIQIFLFLIRFAYEPLKSGENFRRFCLCLRPSFHFPKR